MSTPVRRTSKCWATAKRWRVARLLIWSGLLVAVLTFWIFLGVYVIAWFF